MTNNNKHVVDYVEDNVYILLNLGINVFLNNVDC
jgi:hypothetical protein